MEELHTEGLATRGDPESCVDDPRGRGEALTGRVIAKLICYEASAESTRSGLRARARRVAIPGRAPVPSGLVSTVLRRIREVDRPVSGAGGAAILAEHDVTLPVQHLAAPVLAHHPRDLLGVRVSVGHAGHQVDVLVCPGRRGGDRLLALDRPPDPAGLGHAGQGRLVQARLTSRIVRVSWRPCPFSRTTWAFSTFVQGSASSTAYAVGALPLTGSR